MNPASAALKFGVDGRLVTVRPTGSGNVNDTYIAVLRTTFCENRFILQRLNRNVFRAPEKIMHNMRVMTEHAHTKLEAEADEADRIWQLPQIIPTHDEQDFLHNGQGDCWRAISLIASARSYERVQNLEHAHEAGLVLGHFHRIVSDMATDCLEDPIPGFHDTPLYLQQMDETLKDPEAVERARSSSEAKRCMRFIDERRDIASVLQDALGRGDLSTRPIHGDPKISNIMIDEDTGKGTSIIDLDTVKPGLIHYDFGDCLRSCCNPAGEEVLDLNDVYFDTDLCEAIVRGYGKFGRMFLTDGDFQYLYDSVRLLAFELGLRFFADYLAGDRYFKVRYDGQNLNRARVQFRLCESIETREPKIRRIIDSVY